MNEYYWKLSVGGRKYDPSQPRVPSGDPRGGQWTATGVRGTVHVGGNEGMIEYAKDRLGIGQREMESMFGYPDLDASVQLKRGGVVDVTWSQEGKEVAHTYLEIGMLGGSILSGKPGKKYSAFRTFGVEDDFRDRGFGARIFNQQLDTLEKAGFEEVHFTADSSIGIYAWAREGAGYMFPGDTPKRISNLKSWMKRKGIEADIDYDSLTTPRHFSDLDIPGVRFSGADIKNDAVPKGLSMHLGKAFMLDLSDDGHGWWDAQILFPRKRT